MKRRASNDPAQTKFVGILWQPRRQSSRLHAGDVIRFSGKFCRVVRVNDCAAVVIMNRPPRVFKTRFDKPVAFQPPPAMFRISPHAEVEVFNRKRI